PPISRAGRQHLCSTPPKLSLMTLPSMRFTLPSRFRWQPPSDFNDGYEDDEASLTWYDSSSSVDDDVVSPPTSTHHHQRHHHHPHPCHLSRQPYPCYPRSINNNNRNNYQNDRHDNRDNDHGIHRILMTDCHVRLDSSIYGNLIDLGHHRANGNANRNQTSNTNNNA